MTEIWSIFFIVLVHNAGVPLFSQEALSVYLGTLSTAWRRWAGLMLGPGDAGVFQAMCFGLEQVLMDWLSPSCWQGLEDPENPMSHVLSIHRSSLHHSGLLSRGL